MFEEEPYDHLPPELLAERQSLIDEIFAAFDGISREGGVSWTEAQLLDNFATPEECAAARVADKETWQELLADPHWRSDGFEWCFLDPNGLAYYLPAGIIRTVQTGWDLDVGFILSQPNKDTYHENRFEETIMAFSLRQALAVKRFLIYMDAIDSDPRWCKALENGWRGISEK